MARGRNDDTGDDQKQSIARLSEALLERNEFWLNLFRGESSSGIAILDGVIRSASGCGIL